MRRVQVVSHGPHCLDGVTAAVAVARYFEGRADVAATFASNSEIDATLRMLRPPAGPEQELWITDISWRERDTDDHLRALADQGLRIVWIDHHRTALERFRAGEVTVPFADRVLSEEFAASKLTYDHVVARAAAEGGVPARLTAFAPVVAMADDNDRWLHRVPGSRELAWVVRALGPDAYDDFLQLDEQVHYTPRMAIALDRAREEIAHSFRIADAWGRTARRTVFALYDAKSLAVSLRRSPDCTVDLSHLARSLGGGGHAAAAGCELPELRRSLAELIAERLTERLR